MLDGLEMVTLAELVQPPRQRSLLQVAVQVVPISLIVMVGRQEHAVASVVVALLVAVAVAVAVDIAVVVVLVVARIGVAVAVAVHTR